MNYLDGLIEINSSHYGRIFKYKNLFIIAGRFYAGMWMSSFPKSEDKCVYCGVNTICLKGKLSLCRILSYGRIGPGGFRYEDSAGSIFTIVKFRDLKSYKTRDDFGIFELRLLAKIVKLPLI